MKTVIVVSMLFVLGQVQPNQFQTQSQFVSTCCEGNINLGSELYSRLAIPMPRFAEQVVRRCDNVYTTVVRKHRDVLEEANTIKLRNILNKFLHECIHITLDTAPCISQPMVAIDYKYQCTHETYEKGQFGKILQETKYKSLVNYSSLSRTGGLLSTLLGEVLNVINNLLLEVGRLVDSLLGRTLGITALIESVIGVVNQLVGGVYETLESLFIKSSGKYLGRTTCKGGTREFLQSPCEKLSFCLDGYVSTFYNDTVKQVYRCLKRKSQQLDLFSLDQIMNL